MVSLPYSRKKRYLSGIDWTIGALNHLSRKATGTGISSQIVLELERSVSKEGLRRRLREAVRALPALSGAPARDITLCPYWKVPARMDTAALDPVVHCPPADSPDDVLACLSNAVNAPFTSDSRHLAFHLIYPDSSDRCLVAMVFDHRLLDARGAEMFLDAAQKGSLPAFAPEPAHLDRWIHRFRAGRQVNRALVPMSGAPIETIPLPPKMKGLPSKFAICCLDENETRTITDTAESEAGYLMLTPYVLAATVRQLDAFLKDKGLPHGNYVVPVSMDMRRNKEQVFLNHLSFLLLHIAGETAPDRAAVIQSIKQQMYEQSTLGLQQAICDVTMLMRIAPVSILAAIMRRIRLMLGSFSFSCVGSSAYESDTFMGVRILNLFHMPRVPVPPGYGFFFNEFRGGLNMVFSYIDGMVTDDDAYRLLEQIRADLHNG